MKRSDGARRRPAARHGVWIGALGLCIQGGPAAAQNAEPGQTPTRLPPIAVEGQQSEQYRTKSATTATKTDTPIEKIPGSVQVIPRAVLDDQQTLRVEEALRNVSGTVFVDGGEGKTFFSRGFSASITQDGLSRTEFTDGDSYGGDLDPYNVERIEVLKGPASILYGRGNPGGTINIITKRPLAEPVYSGRFTVGSFGLFRESIDLTGPLTEDKQFAYRLNAVREDAESFRDEVESERTLFSPVLQWTPRAGTTFLLDGEYAEIKQTPDVGLPRIGNGILAGVPRERFLGEPTDQFRSYKHQGRVRLEHAFSDSTELKTTLALSDTENTDWFTRGSALQANQRTLNRSIIDSGFHFKDVVLQNDLTTKAELAGMEHTFLIGIDLSQRETTSIFNSASASPIDVFNPVYGNTAPTSAFSRFRQDTERRLGGLYVQDQIALSDELSFVAGGRFDKVVQEGWQPTQTLATKKDDAFSPRAGIIYQPIKPISLYAAYSQSFTPPNGFPLSFGGQVLEAETADLYETGVKASLFGDRLLATFALYKITRENVPTADLANPGFQTSTGEQQSRGFEVDLAGEIVRGWRLIAAYAYTDAEITRDATVRPGNRPAGIPEHSGSVWTTYELQDGSLQGLGGGGGVTYVGDRFGNNANTFEVENYTRTDATVFYRQAGYTLRFGINNVFDRDYFLNPTRQNFLLPGAPRTFLATVQATF